MRISTVFAMAGLGITFAALLGAMFTGVALATCWFSAITGLVFQVSGIAFYLQGE